jgi:hypothetical protein
LQDFLSGFFEARGKGLLHRKKLRMVIKKISFVFLTYRWNKEKIFLLILISNSFVFLPKSAKKIGVMQKPAAHRKINFTVLSFFLWIIEWKFQ